MVTSCIVQSYDLTSSLLIYLLSATTSLLMRNQSNVLGENSRILCLNISSGTVGKYYIFLLKL